MSGIRIRAYESSDRGAVLGVIVPILVEYAFAEEVIEEVRRGVDHVGLGFWIAESEGGDPSIVGTVALRKVDDTTCELKRLYLRSDVRRRGAGQALYEHAEAFAREAGFARITLHSSRRFTLARRLYERNGFVAIAELDNAWEDVVFEKDLLAT